MKFSTVFALSFAAATVALPHRVVPRDSSFALQNGQQAIAQNAQFATLTANSSCDSGTNACVGSSFAQCVSGEYVLQSCGSGLICAALPLVNSAGTSITCTTQSDLEQRIAATGATSGSNSTSSAGSSVVASATAVSSAASSALASTTAVSSVAASASSSAATGGTATSASASAAAPSSTTASSGNDTAAQSSLTLLDSLINTGFEDDGTNDSEAGEIASATSNNNFINFCSTINLPLTNGTQVKNGSCNAAPMGVIASTSAMPSAKFVNPPNLGSVTANQNFTIALAINNLETGWFVNPDTNYFAAPQQVNASTGLIMGHSHVVIEQISSMNQTEPTDPTKFAFFTGLNAVAENGQLTATVSGGLPKGTYRMASINAAANHQPVLVAVAQHGSLDDMV
ncbi:hypothetical protein DAEQUDRAFT_672941 [Daedalea quercina L-15889]|uniref:Carbohydrate-binding module family 19 domain-containing protein n=1 Tax=Daedalea quercina L-15889 TaxID=1314783 RepID=A0A165P0T4_9APHY|nr:hypothetical protein DAEQUDRAFT_672941 [Daedalea quercina L-15889]